MSNFYLFQGNPKYYDMDAYLTTHPYIYWRCPNYKEKIKVGDKAILWRAGKDAGMIAIGEIVEAPIPASEIKYPELLGQRFWTSEEVDENDIKVGINIQEVRISNTDGVISRGLFKLDPIVSSHRIITNPTGTVFQIDEAVANAMYSAWYGGIEVSDESHLPQIHQFSEGKQRLVLHRRRERSKPLRKAKVASFLEEHNFIHCELCCSNLNDIYPPSLANGFIEVHHIKPIASLREHSPTHLDDLILLCPNCHRMVHRTKEAEKNFKELQEWFLDK